MSNPAGPGSAAPHPFLNSAAPADPQLVAQLLALPLDVIFRPLGEQGQPMMRFDGLAIEDHRGQAVRNARGADLLAWHRYLADGVALTAWEQGRRDLIVEILSRDWDLQRSPGARITEMVASLPLDLRRDLDEVVAQQYPGRRPTLPR